MDIVLILLPLAGIGAAGAWLLRTRLSTEAPTRRAYDIPDHVNRADLPEAAKPWMVALFSSSTCLACQATWEKVQLLASDEVGVANIDSTSDAELHARYGVDAVPMVLVLDGPGFVRAHFLGEPTAADLWAKVAEAREMLIGE